jgi:hypothetical protein
MENEGIMGLPAGQAMQDPRPTDQPLYVSSADSYDAALTALGMSSGDPAQAEAVRQAVRESIDELDLSPAEVSALLEVLEYMSQKPDEYPQLRQRLIDTGMMDADDLPEEYDPAFLGVAIMALNEYQASGAQGAQAPMEMSPAVEGLEPMAMAQGGLADVAKYLASQGRNGDSILAHITPGEARLLKAMGGSGTINPKTTLPEFFLKKLFKGVKKAVKKVLKNPIFRVIATVALATVLGPAAASVVGAATGTAAGVALSTTAAAASTALASTAAAAGVSAMAGEKINAKSLLINAATSYFGAGGTAFGVNPVSSIAKYAGKIPGVTEGGKLAQGIGAGVTSAGIGKLAGMGTQEALGMGLQSGVMAGLSYKPPGADQLQEVSVTGKRVPMRTQAGQAYDMVAGGSDTPNPDAMRGVAPGTARDPGYGTVIEGQYNPATFNTAAAPQTQPVGSSVPYVTSSGAPGARFEQALARATDVSAAPATPPGPGMFGRMGSYLTSLAPGGETPSFDKFKNAFLVNPDAASTLGRYVPGVATALAVTGLAGGFKAGKSEENPLFDRKYTGEDYIRDNPEKFAGGLTPTVLKPYNPVVETPSYGLDALNTNRGPSPTAPGPYPTMPVSPVPRYFTPSGSPTNMPEGIPQPYNVSGTYGVPLLYGNPVQPARPTGYRQGGAVTNAVKQAAKDPFQVAQTEGLLYGGPEAAMAAGQAVQTLNKQNNQGIMAAQGLRDGGQPTHFPRKTGPINGPGTGTSDSIPAMLSDGEFVFTARAVRNAGGGSRRKGARRMYKLMKMLEGGKVEGK